MGSFSIWHWLVILAIVLLLFGTKRLRNLGSDLGGAIKGFKNAVKDEAKKDEEAAKEQQKTENLPHKEGEQADAGRVIEGEAVQHREQEKSSDKQS